MNMTVCYLPITFQEKDSENVEYYKKRGRNCRRMNDLPKAISDFQKVVEKQPTCLDSWIELGEVMVDVGNYKDARKSEFIWNQIMQSRNSNIYDISSI